MPQGAILLQPSSCARCKGSRAACGRTGSTERWRSGPCPLPQRAWCQTPFTAGPAARRYPAAGGGFLGGSPGSSPNIPPQREFPYKAGDAAYTWPAAGILTAGDTDRDAVARRNQAVILDTADKTVPNRLLILFNDAAFHLLAAFPYSSSSNPEAPQPGRVRPAKDFAFTIIPQKENGDSRF